MESNPLRGFFMVSSPRSEPQLVAPQPTTPTENICYEIPSGMIEQLLANPYAGDGTKRPDMHLIYVDKISGEIPFSIDSNSKIKYLRIAYTMSMLLPSKIKGKPSS